MKIAFTGGGTAGHAMVNTILIPYLQKMDCHVIYLGSHHGMEKEMIAALPSVPYYAVSTGKLRRYCSIENFKDIFRVAAGCLEAYRILKAERPQLIYSGGGYVSVPVVLAARWLHIPILIRETDMSMGLANRLCLPFAHKVFTAFPHTLKTLPAGVDSSYPGVLIRPGLLNCSSLPCDSPSGKPLCLIVGGSTGAQAINEVIWNHIESLTSRYDIIHICGKGNLNGKVRSDGAYRQLEYVHGEMGELLHAADVVVTRCGSNAILETLALGKRMVCIPMNSRSSRGEQEENGAFAVAHGNAVILKECSLNGISLYHAIDQALKLQRDTPFQITRERLSEHIHEHVNEIYAIGLNYMEKHFYRSLTGKAAFHFRDLSNMELFLYDEIASTFGEY